MGEVLAVALVFGPPGVIGWVALDAALVALAVMLSRRWPRRAQ